MTADYASGFDRGFRAGVEAAANAAQEVKNEPYSEVDLDDETLHWRRGMARGAHRAEVAIRALQPPQQPDAAPSDFVATMREIRSELTAAGITVDAAAFARERNLEPALAAWQALSDSERMNVVIHLALREGHHDKTALVGTGNEGSDRIHAAQALACHVAADLLRSLAPEAGDADGGKR